MTIFKYVQYQISCDECPCEDSDYDNCTQAEAIKNTRNDGWYISKDRHLGPNCVDELGIKLRVGKYKEATS